MWMKRIFIFALMIVFITVATGCSSPLPIPQEQDATEQKPDPVLAPPAPEYPQQTGPSLGGVRLGMTMDDVTDILGGSFSDQIEEEGGYFREGLIIRHYLDGCDLVIGQTSGQVLQIDVSSPDYPTDMGVKVGDQSIPALKKYQDKYPEYIGNQSSEKLAGWFVIEPGTLLIFSSKDNRERSNRDLTDDSKIYAITLGHIEYFD